MINGTRAAIYTRISKDDEHEGQGLARQAEDLSTHLLQRRPEQLHPLLAYPHHRRTSDVINRAHAAQARNTSTVIWADERMRILITHG